MLATTNKSIMDASSQKQIAWHYETLPRQTKKALDFLSEQKWLQESKWYLAGGTALAIQVGNRKSLDLDFFTEEIDFDEKNLLKHFIGNKNWLADIKEKSTVYGKLFKAKVSFIAYPFFIPKQKLKSYGSIRVLSPLDIAVMKIIAISQRGRKRDFFDLYWCANNIEPLENIIKRLRAQYPSVAHNYHHILKSIVYFDDAEIDPDPVIYFNADWKKVKSFFRKEVPIIAKRIMK